MKQFFKRIISLPLPWFKIFIISAVILFLLIQYLNFKMEEKRAFIECLSSARIDIEICQRIYPSTINFKIGPKW